MLLLNLSFTPYYSLYYHSRMMYYLTIVLCCIFITLLRSEELTVENCHCNEGYKTAKTENGTLECIGINVYNSEPCNTVNPPTCNCTGDVSSIVIDEKGTWCSATPKADTPSKLWPCENKEEWIAYRSTNEKKP